MIGLEFCNSLGTSVILYPSNRILSHIIILLPFLSLIPMISINMLSSSNGVLTCGLLFQGTLAESKGNLNACKP